MRRLAVGCLFVLIGCSTAQRMLPSKPGYWLGVFPPHPGAKFICSQHISGTPIHISWSLYAATALPSQVFAFYADQGLASEFYEPSTGEYIWQVGGQKTLHILNAFEQHPDCDTKVPANMQTVFIVSQSTGR